MKFSTASLIVSLSVMNLAAETQVRIVGLKSNNEAEVLGLLGGRLEHVRESDASGSRADDAAFLLKQVLEKDGYSAVTVKWQIVNRSEIRLVVNEGGRRSLGTVTVDGAPAELNERLAKIYSRPASKNRPLGSGDPPFREEDLTTGLSFVEQELNAQGYWGAKVTLAERETDQAGYVNLRIEIVANPLYIIAQPVVVGAGNSSLTEVQAAISVLVGEPANTANLNSMRAAVEEIFVSTGYPDAKITMGRKLVGAKFVPEFLINLGTRVRLNEVRVQGLQKTNPQRIRSRMEDLEGDWYDEAAMNKRVRGLLATGAFTSVRVETQAISEGRIDATLHLEEGKAREFTAAAGGDSYQGFLVRTTYTDRNLMGELLGFSTGFEFSARGVLGETSLTDPWLFGKDIAGTLRVYALTYGREGYSSIETGLDAKILRKFGDHYSFEVLAGYSVVDLTEDGLPIAELGDTTYTHPKLRFNQTIDFRDSPILPTKGWHIQTPFEIGAALGDFTTAYVSSGVTGGWYHRLNEKYQIGLGGEFGLLIPSGDGDSLPIDLRYFNGGARSVRSFAERELGPSVNGYATGGEAMWNTSFELIRSINGTFKAVGFIDTGSVARSYADLPSSEVEIAIGLGVRIDLPIGPVRLEYGHNLTQDVGEARGALHFAIGIAF